MDSHQQIIFVTGKGGVGKSALAAALALKEAKTGRKTLLVELGNQSFYKDYMHLQSVSYEPSFIRENLWISLWAGTDCLHEYARHLLKIEALYQLFFQNPVSKALLNIAPALPELSILGKITSGIRKVGPSLDYETLIIDAYSTGHFLALLAAPYGMSKAIQVGPMGEQSRQIDKVLRDPRICQYVIVATPEEMPVLEAIELGQKLKAAIHQEPTFYLNKMVPVPVAALQEKPSEDFLIKYQDYLVEREKTQLELKSTFEQEIQKQTTKKLKEVSFIFSNQGTEIIEQISAQEI